MSPMASRITCFSVVYPTFCSGTDQRKHESSASLAFVRGIHRWPVNSPNKERATRKVFPFDDAIMYLIRPCHRLSMMTAMHHFSVCSSTCKHVHMSARMSYVPRHQIQSGIFGYDSKNITTLSICLRGMPTFFFTFEHLEVLIKFRVTLYHQNLHSFWYHWIR